jgi:short-subunit dehydrogenase
MKDLKGKTAVVTGAAMGMGKSLAASLLREGCTVALVDLNKEALNETAAELNKLGPCSAFVCDIADRKAVYELAGKIDKALGKVAILVNNAGIVRAGSVEEMDDETVEKIININLVSQFWTTKAFLPSIKKQPEGHIVNFASAGGILAIPWISAYCASKFGVIGFTDALRQEMKKMKLKIGVTVVCPNTVNTGMFQGSKMVAGTKMLSAEGVTKKVLNAIKKNKPMVAVPSFPVRFLTPLTKVLLPINAMDWMNKTLGMWDANDTWTGRK